MNKTKIILLCLFIPLFALVVIIFFKIKHKEEIQQKLALTRKIERVSDYLMLDLLEEHRKAIQDVPADGLWHKRMFRIRQGTGSLLPGDIANLLVRRQRATPGILEVRIENHGNFSLISNLRIRTH